MKRFFCLFTVLLLTAFGQLIQLLNTFPLPDVENPEDYCSEPEVTAYCDEYGMHKFIHIGEFHRSHQMVRLFYRRLFFKTMLLACFCSLIERRVS